MTFLLCERAIETKIFSKFSQFYDNWENSPTITSCCSSYTEAVFSPLLHEVVMQSGNS